MLWLLCLTLIFVLCPTAWADNPGEVPQPLPRQRWSEDWSMLRDVAPLAAGEQVSVSEYLKPLKYIRLGESSDSHLSFGGEYRLAYERYDEADAGVSNIGVQDAVQHRLAFHVDWFLNPEWRAFGQLGYASQSGREGGAKATDETDIDIWQLFVDKRFYNQDSDYLVLRFGRQTIETANAFITAGEAHNIRLSYDGLRLAWLESGQAKYEAFASEYVDYADGSFDMSGTGEYFWGLRGGQKVGSTGINLDALYLGWSLKDRQFQQGGGGLHDELRHTLLLWLNRPLTGGEQWGLDYYFAYQFGAYEDRPGDSDIKAWSAFGELKHALYERNSTPIFGLKTSYFSGDSDSGDNELNTFYNPVFGTPYFGYARDVMPFNLIHVQPNIGYRLESGTTLTLSYEFLWRADSNDAYYNSANGITVPADVSRSRKIGRQAQLALHYRPIDNIIINAYVSRLFADEFLEAGGGSDRDYFHLGVNFLL